MKYIFAIEAVGAASGVLNVWLTARASILCWPIGLLNAVAYTFIFFESKLYADMGLQAIYIALTIFGWAQWLRGDSDNDERKISNAPLMELSFTILAAILLWFIIWSILAKHTDGSVIWADSLLSAASIAATWLMARKYIACWIWWIIIDALYLPLYIYKGLFLTALLYSIFATLAFYGYKSWREKISESIATG